ncbi:MAG: 1-acyl-sn-glycerol-3-phosphate acyltransferase [Bacteroidales bacterium]|nr:1-acyl-sn-glycerol-3-phosphate acyltransferase [Bacteroidales bacterium]
MANEIEQKPAQQSNLLDIEKVLKDKNPTLKKLLPGFVMRYLKRIIHQEELNFYLTEFRDRYGVDFIDSVLSHINTKLALAGLENIPTTEKCIVASNHPLGGLDGMALMLAVSRVRRDIIFPVNDLLMNIKNLEVMFIPINKHGSNSENIKIINDTFASDKLVCYFPAGLVSRKQKGKILDLEWKTTFITKAKRFKRDIIPTHISGRNTNFFYNLANLRKKIGLKANIEMLYLVDELHKQRNKTLRITFGQRIPYATFNNRYKKEKWALLMREYIYLMGDGLKQPFDEWVSGS